MVFDFLLVDLCR